MASKARLKFDQSLGDIEQLVDFYNALETLSEADGEPIPTGADVLFRSALVLLVSHWEVYVEDICSEALEHMVAHATSASDLPKEIKQHVATDLKKAPNEIEVWKIADDGWRDYLKSRLVPMQETRNRSFNTPKAQPTAEFFERGLGLADVTTAWNFGKLSPAEARKKLDLLIEARGQIAHRGQITPKIDKDKVIDYTKFIRDVASKTGGRINAHVKKITKKGLW